MNKWKIRMNRETAGSILSESTLKDDGSSTSFIKEEENKRSRKSRIMIHPFWQHMTIIIALIIILHLAILTHAATKRNSNTKIILKRRTSFTTTTQSHHFAAAFASTIPRDLTLRKEQHQLNQQQSYNDPSDDDFKATTTATNKISSSSQFKLNNQILMNHKNENNNNNNGLPLMNGKQHIVNVSNKNSHSYYTHSIIPKNDDNDHHDNDSVIKLNQHTPIITKANGNAKTSSPPSEQQQQTLKVETKVMNQLFNGYSKLDASSSSSKNAIEENMFSTIPDFDAEIESRKILKSYAKIGSTLEQQSIDSSSTSMESSTGKTTSESSTSPLFRLFQRNTDEKSTTNIWKRRYARSVEEGIRGKQNDTVQTTDTSNNNATECKKQALSSLLKDASESVVTMSPPDTSPSTGIAARTITGLIRALAEEATGLEVEVDARKETPPWRKQIDSVKINFSRLSCQQLRMGALEKNLNSIHKNENNRMNFANRIVQYGRRKVRSMEEAFDDIDKDKSGALDEEELAEALGSMGIISPSLYENTISQQNNDTLKLPSSNFTLAAKESFLSLAQKLVSLYDTNGDGVVDRDEYKTMVEDISALQKAQVQEREEEEDNKNWMKRIPNPFQKSTNKDENNDSSQNDDVTDGADLVETITKGDGSIILSDLKLDMTRFIFGAIPIVKRVRNIAHPLYSLYRPFLY